MEVESTVHFIVPARGGKKSFETMEQEQDFFRCRHQEQQMLAGEEHTRSMESQGHQSIVSHTTPSTEEGRNRWILGSVLVLILICIGIDYCTNRNIERACWAFIHWVEENPFRGIVAVIGVYTLATILFVPGAILTIGWSCLCCLCCLCWGLPRLYWFFPVGPVSISQLGASVGISLSYHKSC